MMNLHLGLLNYAISQVREELPASINFLFPRTRYFCFLSKLSMCKLYSQKPGMMLKGCLLSLGQSQFAQAKKNSKRKTQKKVPWPAIMLQVQVPSKTYLTINTIFKMLWI